MPTRLRDHSLLLKNLVSIFILFFFPPLRSNYDTLNVRTVKPASLVNTAGNVVAPGPASFVSAMNDFANISTTSVLFLGTLPRE